MTDVHWLVHGTARRAYDEFGMFGRYWKTLCGASATGVYGRFFDDDCSNAVTCAGCILVRFSEMAEIRETHDLST